MSARPGKNQRHIHYLDLSIQKWLLVALVAMEVALTVIATWMLYKALGEAIDQDLYRIHLADKLSVFGYLLREGMKMLGVILLVNVAALILADRVWAYGVNRILRSLTALIDAALQLDFSAKAHIPCNHAVLVQALAWRNAERVRIEGIRHDISTLPDLPATTKEREEVADRLKKILGALP